MLREAHEDDVATMLAWRNQAANREVSIQQHVITPEEHAAWWSRTRQDATRRVLVFEANARPLGVVSFFDLRLEEPSRSGAWGFYLDHESVGRQGLAVTAWMQVMREALDHAFDKLGLDVLHGEVLVGNEAVRSMNRRFRFVEGAPESRDVGGSVVEVVPVSLRREDRRSRRVRS